MQTPINRPTRAGKEMPMNEWGVVGVLIALVGFGVTVVKPLLALNTSIVKLTTRIDLMTDSLDEISTKNEKSHDRIWRHNDEQDATIDDHEHRITVLEQRGQ